MKIMKSGVAAEKSGVAACVLPCGDVDVGGCCILCVMCVLPADIVPVFTTIILA